MKNNNISIKIIKDRLSYTIENIFKKYNIGIFEKEIFNQINLLTLKERDLTKFWLFPQI